MTFASSPELVLPSSLPSSPSVPSSLRRLSIASSGNGSDSEKETSAASDKRRRLSGAMLALKHGDDVQRAARERERERELAQLKLTGRA